MQLLPIALIEAAVDGIEYLQMEQDAAMHSCRCRWQLNGIGGGRGIAEKKMVESDGNDCLC